MEMNRDRWMLLLFGVLTVLALAYLSAFCSR